MGLHPDWVFPGKKQGRPVSNSIMLDTLKRMNRRDVTVHGFRTSFRVWAAERTAYPREMAELALAHKLGTQVEEAYQRSDLFERRRDLMLDWAHYVGGDASLGEKSCGSCK
jgi:integrase